MGNIHNNVIPIAMQTGMKTMSLKTIPNAGRSPTQNLIDKLTKINDQAYLALADEANLFNIQNVNNYIINIGFLFYSFNVITDSGSVLVGSKVIADILGKNSNLEVNLTEQMIEIDHGHILITALRVLIELLFSYKFPIDRGNIIDAYMPINNQDPIYRLFHGFMLIIEVILDDLIENIFKPLVTFTHTFEYCIPMKIDILESLLVVLNNFSHTINTSGIYDNHPTTLTELIHLRKNKYTDITFGRNMGHIQSGILDLFVLPITYNSIQINLNTINILDKFNKSLHNALVYDDNIINNQIMNQPIFWDDNHLLSYLSANQMITNMPYNINNFDTNNLLVNNKFMIDNKINIKEFNDQNEDLGQVATVPNAGPNDDPNDVANMLYLYHLTTFYGTVIHEYTLNNNKIIYLYNIIYEDEDVNVNYIISPYMVISVDLNNEVNNTAILTLSHQIKFNILNVELLPYISNIVEVAQYLVSPYQYKYIKKNNTYYYSYNTMLPGINQLNHVCNINIFFDILTDDFNIFEQMSLAGYNCDRSRIALDLELRDNDTIIHFYDFATKAIITFEELMLDTHIKQFYKSELIAKYIVYKKNPQANDIVPNLLDALHTPQLNIAILFNHTTTYYGTLSNIQLNYRGDMIQMVTISGLAVKLENPPTNNYTTSLLISDHINIMNLDEYILEKLFRAFIDKLNNEPSYIWFIRQFILNNDGIQITGHIHNDFISRAIYSIRRHQNFTNNEIICYWIMRELLLHRYNPQNQRRNIEKYLQFKFNGKLKVYYLEHHTNRPINALDNVYTTKTTLQDIYNIEVINPFIDQPYWTHHGVYTYHGSRFYHGV